jgi:pimeloyl-ACP methyl ester carboxylesterase
MSARVDPEPAPAETNGHATPSTSPGWHNTGFTFKKPLKPPGTPPFAEYDQSYIDRKASLEEKFFSLQSGRKLCYVIDGPAKEGLNPSDDECHIILCLHCCGGTKWQWLQKKPLENICLVMIDRVGHGGSSSGPANNKKAPGEDGLGAKTEPWQCNYGYDVACPELGEFIDSIYEELGVSLEKKYHVIGHSMGGTLSLELAACPATKNRIAAIAPCSAPADCWSPDRFSKKDYKDYTGGKWSVFGCLQRNQQKKGWKGRLSRWFWNSVVAPPLCKPYSAADIAKGDWGAQAHWDQSMSQGTKVSRDVLFKDPFFDLPFFFTQFTVHTSSFSRKLLYIYYAYVSVSHSRWG